jgi:hypothetical protein
MAVAWHALQRTKATNKSKRESLMVGFCECPGRHTMKKSIITKILGARSKEGKQ